jgi:hypothetical protein
MNIESFLSSYGEDFRVEREGQVISTVEGVRHKEKKNIDFRPNTDVRPGDWLLSKADKRYYVLDTDTQPGFNRETFSLVASYQTETQHAQAADRTPPQPSQEFTFYGPAYGMFGSQQDFTFDQVIHDLDRKIEELGGEDKEELRQMAEEVKRVLESQDSISRSKFSKWSELASKHLPWITGPLGSLLVNYAFGAPPRSG